MITFTKTVDVIFYSVGNFVCDISACFEFRIIFS